MGGVAPKQNKNQTKVLNAESFIENEEKKCAIGNKNWCKKTSHHTDLPLLC